MKRRKKKFLQPLTNRDSSMPDMTESFDFTIFDFTNGGPWATPPAQIMQRRDGTCDLSKE